MASVARRSLFGSFVDDLLYVVRLIAGRQQLFMAPRELTIAIRALTEFMDKS
jgi:hypothetical protein